MSSGSKGNAVVLEDEILIDCGVSYKALRPYLGGLKIVLCTHCHSDHFNRSTIRKLAYDRPALRFGCGEWLVKHLLGCGVSAHMIDIYAMNTHNIYSSFGIEAFGLYHNVPNCGYKIDINGRMALYATDTSKIETFAQDYDLYMIEANYDDEEIERRIAQKKADGVQYIYEYKARENHLSLSAANEFLFKNAGENSEFVFMHIHEKESA